MLEEQSAQAAAAVKAAHIDIGSLQPSADAAPTFWPQLRFIPVGAGKYIVPAGVIVLDALETTGGPALIDLLKTMEVPATIGIIHAARRKVIYRLPDPEHGDQLAKVLPEGVALLRENDAVALPDDWTQQQCQVRSIAELAELTRADIAKVGKRQPDAVVTSNPLLPFSLRGQSEKFKRLALEATPLLGNVCLRGQVTIWYAGPNTGKTLFALSLAIDAVREGRIAGGNIFYINADDNGAGFATKLQIMDDIEANTLAPGFKGLRTGELIALLQRMADHDEARGVLIIIDTVKKFGSLMDKKEASAMAQAFRQVAMKGGTVLGLAHTTKSPNADGTPRYAGTSDLVDDADAVYTLKRLQNVGAAGEQVVQFDRVKSRGASAECAAYSFTAEAVPYEELLASVQAIDPMQVDEFKRIEDQRSDAEVIAAVTACLEEGINTKMLLAKEVAARIDISARAAGRLIERYTGSDPAEHRWSFSRGNRGAQVFELLTAPPEIA